MKKANITQGQVLESLFTLNPDKVYIYPKCKEFSPTFHTILYQGIKEEFPKNIVVDFFDDNEKNVYCTIENTKTGKSKPYLRVKTRGKSTNARNILNLIHKYASKL